MNKANHIALPPKESLADLAHFAWCALVGLRLAQQDGLARSPLTIHTFLVRWLADVQKQRRFPRSVAYSALIDHVFAWNVDQRFAADRSSGGLNFSTAF